MAKIKKNPYERVAVISLDILPQLMDERPARYLKKINGVMVKLSSQRYSVFKKSTVCCRCGVEGKYFGIERTRGSRKDETFHLNLYAVKEDGFEVLMTKDHIIPRSRGGADTLDNYQTMCAKCNSKKGNKIES